MADALLVLSQTALRRAAGSQLSVPTVHAACFDPGSYHLPASGDQLTNTVISWEREKEMVHTVCPNVDKEKRCSHVFFSDCHKVKYNWQK